MVKNIFGTKKPFADLDLDVRRNKILNRQSKQKASGAIVDGLGDGVHVTGAMMPKSNQATSMLLMDDFAPAAAPIMAAILGTQVAVGLVGGLTTAAVSTSANAIRMSKQDITPRTFSGRVEGIDKSDHGSAQRLHGELIRVGILHQTDSSFASRAGTFAQNLAELPKALNAVQLNGASLNERQKYDITVILETISPRAAGPYRQDTSLSNMLKSLALPRKQFAALLLSLKQTGVVVKGHEATTGAGNLVVQHLERLPAVLDHIQVKGQPLSPEQKARIIAVFEAVAPHAVGPSDRPALAVEHIADHVSGFGRAELGKKHAKKLLSELEKLNYVQREVSKVSGNARLVIGPEAVTEYGLALIRIDGQPLNLQQKHELAAAIAAAAQPSPEYWQLPSRPSADAEAEIGQAHPEFAALLDHQSHAVSDAPLPIKPGTVTKTGGFWGRQKS